VRTFFAAHPALRAEVLQRKSRPDERYRYRLQRCGKDGTFLCHYANKRANSGWYCDEDSL
jgi:hypothetical protein